MNEITPPAPLRRPSAPPASTGSVLVLPSRGAPADLLRQPSPLAQRDVRAALLAVRAELARAQTDPSSAERARDETFGLLHQAMRRAGAGPLWLTDYQVARLLVGLADRGVRDRMIDWSCGEHASVALTVWTELASRAVPPYELAPLTLTAWSAWVQDRTELARLAVERALALDPRCRLAWLVGQALRRDLGPACARPTPPPRCRPPGSRAPGGPAGVSPRARGRHGLHRRRRTPPSPGSRG